MPKDIYVIKNKEIDVKISFKLLKDFKYLSSLPNDKANKIAKKIIENVSDYLHSFKGNNGATIKIKRKEFKLCYFWWLFEKNQWNYSLKEVGLEYDKELYDERTMLFAKLMDYFNEIIPEETKALFFDEDKKQINQPTIN
jgi:hypothetical protein